MANLKGFFLLIFLVSCGMTTEATKLPTVIHQEISIDKIQGTILSTEGEKEDLAASPDKIHVLMFVSETCGVCQIETKNLIQDRIARGIPANALFYSVLVGSDPQDAKDWESSMKVDWKVGTDKGDELFRKYCPRLQTPCTLLTNPTTGLLFTLIGEHPLSELEKVTGEWRF